MIFLNIFRLSIRSFKNMRLRSTLTVLGIGIGIGAILFLVSLGQGLQRLLISRITTAAALLTLDVSPAADNLVAIDKDALEEIKKISSVSEVSPMKSEKAKISFEGVTAGITANFIEDNFFYLSGLDKLLVFENVPDKNSKQKKEDVRVFKSEGGVVLSRAVLKLLSIEKSPLDVSVGIYVSNEREEIVSGSYKVTGIIEDDLNSFAYLPALVYPQAKLDFYNNVKVQARSTEVIELAREEIIAKGFVVSALSDTVQQAKRVFSIMQIILGIFGAIALAVAAIGMFNTMTIALLERTNEIGIMRSIGASRKDIWFMFLTEALIIGFLGGLSGVLIGIGVAELSNAGLNFLASRLGGEPLSVFYYPPWFVVLVIVFSTVVAFATGFYPAQRAANLNPLDALRYK